MSEEKRPYKVRFGKHFLGKAEDGKNKYAREGDIVHLTATQAEKWKGKFLLVETVQVSSEEVTKPQVQEAPRSEETQTQATTEA